MFINIYKHFSLFLSACAISRRLTITLNIGMMRLVFYHYTINTVCERLQTFSAIISLLVSVVMIRLEPLTLGMMRWVFCHCTINTVRKQL
jgi:hypothetical protein